MNSSGAFQPSILSVLIRVNPWLIVFPLVLRRWLTFFLLCLLSFTAAAEVAVPPLTHRITDLTGTLTPEQQAALESRLQNFETQKGSQISVLIVPTTQPEAIEQYSIRVVEQWKLGRKGVDDGVLLLVAKDDRALRIEVGYGLEGILPDAIAKRIVAEDITPHFKQGDFYGGIVAGSTRILAVLQGETLPAPQQQSRSTVSLESYFPFLLFGALVSGAVLRRVLGTFPGALVNGGLTGIVVLLLGGGILFAVFIGIMAFAFALGGGRRWGGGGFGTGGFGRGGDSGFGGGGFSGGGGGFGGGGASGKW